MPIMQLDKVDLTHTATAIMADERGVRSVRILPRGPDVWEGPGQSKKYFF